MKKSMYFAMIRIITLVMALALIILLIFFSSSQKKPYDNNVLFVVDLSYSMNAKDIKWVNWVKWVKWVNWDKKISRLEAAKRIIKQVVEAWGVANYGLAIFSQSATHYVPLTNDTWTFLDYLEHMNTWLLPGWGTDRNSLERIFSGDTTEYSKIIFISDAEKSDSRVAGPGLSAKSFNLAKKYFIGVGTELWGNPTLPNGTIMNMNGKNIVSSFDLDTATASSAALHAKLFHIENMNTLDSIVDEIVRSSQNFSHSQVQLLVVVLCVFILLIL